VGTPFLLKKINKIKANCPFLKYVITTFDDKKADDVASYEEMIDEGKKALPSAEKRY
jgi:hypothetical protein